MKVRTLNFRSAGVRRIILVVLCLGMLASSVSITTQQLKESNSMSRWFLASNNPKLNKGEYYYFDEEKKATPVTEDFVETKEVSLSNLKDMVNKLGTVAEPSEVEGYRIHEDGGIIYDPLYQEASLTGQLNKYNKAYLTKGSLKLGKSTLTYEVPQNATAYDVVPIKYKLTTESDEWMPIHVEANAFEEKERTNGKKLFDMNLPGNVSCQYEFLGYSTGMIDMSTRPQLTNDGEGDIKGTAFPNMDTTPLTLSSEVPLADETWYRIKLTNNGNTILDPDGNGSFLMLTRLEVKNDSGWATVTTGPNHGYTVLTDYVYPGESKEFWLDFGKMGAGHYRIVIDSRAQYESSSTGNTTSAIKAQTCYYEFDIKSNATIKAPEKTTFTQDAAMDTMRNTWLHTFQEFLCTYDTWLFPEPAAVNEGVLYLQVAPWTKDVTLKLINGDEMSLETASVPINVDTESIKINFNPNNNHYVIDEHGKRYPTTVTQTMADMRMAYVVGGPNSDEVIANQLIDMKEAGINTLYSTNGFIFDRAPLTPDDKSVMEWNKSTDAFKLAMDVSRSLGLKIFGHMTYPYQSGSEEMSFAAGEPVFVKETRGFSDPAFIVGNAARGKYSFMRWGDNFWTRDNGSPVFYMEDTRGRKGMMDYLEYRYEIGSLGLFAFQKFLKEVYGDIATLNKAWGTKYTDFSKVDPEEGGVRGGAGGYDSWVDQTGNTGTFKENGVPMRVFDIFRSVERATQYQQTLQILGDTVPNPTMVLSTETLPWMVPGINPKTTNPRYRSTYYQGASTGAIPEIIAASGTVYAVTDYCYEPAFRPSEVYELTKRSIAGGVVPMYMPRLSRFFDIVWNEKYGREISASMNSSNSISGKQIAAMSAAFTWMTATYEAGGVPGIFWQDYTTGGTVSVTQIKELKFFKEKMMEALSTPEGKKWADKGQTADLSWMKESKAAWSYEESYIKQLISDATALRKPNQQPW